MVALDAAKDAPGAGALDGVGALWTLGQPVALGGLTGGGRRTRLPGYPFAGPRSVAPEALPSPAPDPAPSPLPRTAARGAGGREPGPGRRRPGGGGDPDLGGAARP
ncbi:hypothetical protein LT493_36380 [Streptomyces tricolor]|nr:hypothetical protein [Streptomyces tricolor]